MTITTYAQAAAFLQGGRNKSARTIPGIRFTQVIRLNPSTVSIRYHATDVVVYHASGDITCNTGGFKTLTTKARINEFANLRLFQRKRIWYLTAGEEFRDGYTINRSLLKLQRLPLD